MKLGEALSVRARQATKLNDLRGRIKANAKTQEGTPAPEDANTLIEEFVSLSSEHTILVARINKTNAATIVGGGITLLDLLLDREHLNRERSILDGAANSATTQDGYRYMRSELATVPTVDVTALRARSDEQEKKVAALDAQIQQVNWATELIAV